MMVKKILARALNLTIILTLIMIATGSQVSSAACLQSISTTSGAPVGSRLPISPVSNAPEHDDEEFPSIAFNSGFMQNYLVVWTQPVSSGIQGIYGQFLTKNGALNGIRFPITAEPTFGLNAYPDIVYNPTLDQFLVVYESGSGIYGQLISNAGTRIGSEITIVTGIAGEDTFFYPAVAYSPTSQKYLVTWRRTHGTLQGIEARTLSGDGTTWGSVWELTGLIPSDPDRPDVAYTSSIDSFLVVWQKTFTGFTDHDIYAQRIQMGASPGPTGTVFSIFASTLDETNPSIGAIDKINGIGQYLVACQVDITGTPYINGQLVIDSGVLDGSSMAVSLSSGSVPAVAGNNHTQEYLVAWIQTPNVYARTISTAGLNGQIAPMSGEAPWNPAVASGPLGDFLIAVDDWISSSYPYDIFGYLWGTRVFLPMVLR